MHFPLVVNLKSFNNNRFCQIHAPLIKFFFLNLLNLLAVPVARSCKQGGPGPEPTTRRGVRNKKTKSKRVKQVESSDSTTSHRRQQQLRPPLLTHDLNPTSWSLSDASQSAYPVAYPAVMPGYPLQVYPRTSSMASCTDPNLAGFGYNQGAQAPPCTPSVPSGPYSAPLVTPVVALVLPNYMYPPMVTVPAPPQPFYQTETGGFPTQAHHFGQTVFPGQATFAGPTPFDAQNQFISQSPYATQAGFLAPLYYNPPPPEIPKAPVDCLSRSSTPHSLGGGGHASPPLFQSCCSSPLNLLQLELSVDRPDGAALSSGGQANAGEREKGGSGSQAKDGELKQVRHTFNLFSLLSPFLLLPFLSFSFKSLIT